MAYFDSKPSSLDILWESMQCSRQRRPAAFADEDDVFTAPVIDVCTAASIGDYDFVYEALESRNIKIVKRNLSGWTPMMYACYNDHDKIVELLISQGIGKYDQNNVGQTPLMLAALNGNEKILGLVYEDHIIDRRDEKGWTALFYAIYRRRENITKFLLKNGADINIISRDNGYTTLMMAAAAGKTSIVKMLLEAGANPYKTTRSGETAVSIAHSHGFFPIVQLLSLKTITCEKPLLDLRSLLISLDLKDYWPLFQRNNISIEQFLFLTEENLKDIGIIRMGPRKKLASVILNWQLQQHRPSRRCMCSVRGKQCN